MFRVKARGIPLNESETRLRDFRVGRPMFWRPNFVAGCLLSLALFCVSSSDAQVRIEGSQIGDGAVKVDGRLDEAAWQAAPIGRGMTERQPMPGAKAPIDFAFRVLYDSEALYFGIESSYQSDWRPISRELRRDTYNIWSDDTITIKLDVHRDQVTTTGFAFNAAGAQTDFIAMTSGGGFRREFDAVWESVSTLENGRWTAEVRIPFTALGMPESAELQSLGLNVTRDHNRRMATYDWSPLPPELGPVAATHYGRLDGIQTDGAGGRAVRFIPYILARKPGQDRLLGDHGDVKAGLDLRVRLTQDLWGEATLLTDFAEVDLDDSLVNLTRFPLFLPEKRPFFLSGLDVFNFGDPRAYQLFYSRRVGLDGDGNAVPILGGVKVHGRVGRLGVGALTVTTDDFGALRKTQYTVMRLRQDFDGQGTLGALWVSRFSSGASPEQLSHQSVGLDASYRFLDNRLQLSGFSAMTINEEMLISHAQSSRCNRTELEEGVDGVREAVFGATSKVRMRYVGSAFESDTTLRQVDCRFDPRVGFSNREDVRVAQNETGYTWRGLSGPITRAEVSQSGGLVLEDSSGRYLGAGTQANMEISIENRFELGGTFGYAEDVVDERFDLPNDKVIEPGRYGGIQASFRASSTGRRNPYGGLRYTLNEGFYGGKSHTLSGRLGGAVGSHLRLSTRLSNTWMVFQGEETSQTTTLNADMNIAVSPTLFTDVNIQANTVDESARFLTRLRWRYLPGSDLYIVYQDQLNVDYGRGLRGIESIDSEARSVTLKLTYWYDTLL